jgi:limonene-1,2-epoxide hydrolase
MTSQEFPDVFAHGWSLPKPEPFLSYFLTMIAEDAVFIQPMFPRAVGHEQIARTFRQLFALVPDMTAIPVHTATRDRVVFIESTCTATLAGETVQFTVCDRFEIQDRKIAQRHSYSDPLPLLLAVLRHPSTWPRALKARR